MSASAGSGGRVERTFAAWADGCCWESEDPSDIAPWAAPSGEPVVVRVVAHGAGGRLGVKCAAVLPPAGQDPSEYLTQVAEAMAAALLEDADGSR